MRLLSISLFLIVSFLHFPCAVAAHSRLQAGTAEIDITPTNWPVRVNGMFVERTATNAVDRLWVRCLVLDDGTDRIALAVVDTCMMPRTLLDQAKIAAERAGALPANKILISATHTHSAPAAMGCLGSRVDPDYAVFLPGKLTEAIVQASANMKPARVGWTAVDDWDHTFCRRWIRRPDKMLDDPFGIKNVRAHMHPGHESPDAIGPSGPPDPQLSLLAVQSLDGRPLALLANYSQHYYGSPLLSSDYFGRFAVHFNELASVQSAGQPFLVMMSQGTSGDLARYDYGAPAREIGYDAYAAEMARIAFQAWKGIQYLDKADLAMEEATLTLDFRGASNERLQWARQMADSLQGRLPQTLPEIYALEALEIQARPRAELKLQAIRIGDLGITALPNEVYALTGLQLKAQSPLKATFNIELANGAEGYIPPPEQHRLGGYTTWPARTAGLEVQAEPKIVETLLGLLENVSQSKRRPLRDPDGPYARMVLRQKPIAYYRFSEWNGAVAHDSSGKKNSGELHDLYAWRLPGPDGNSLATGHPTEPPKTPNAFSGPEVNASIHLAGGFLETKLSLAREFSFSLWFWNGLAPEVRELSAVLAAAQAGESKQAHFSIGISGGASGGKLFMDLEGERYVGSSAVGLKEWHSLTLVCGKKEWVLYLNGKPEVRAPGKAWSPGIKTIRFGEGFEIQSSLEGKLDEVAIFNKALPASEIAGLDQLSGYASPRPPRTTRLAGLTSLPKSPEEGLASLQLRTGFRAELVAAEPLIESPVAIDWDTRGRLWVAEMIDYPSGMDGKGKAGGKIRVLTDSDGDGRYDQSQVFAEDLPFPTGLMTWREGVLVTAAPDILFMQDRDGDGKADVREVLFSGFLQGNQQLRVNGLRWGVDHWVYCANGSPNPAYGEGARIRSQKTGKEVVLGSRDFRFRPDTGELELLSGPSQFGRNRNDWGDWFGVQNSWPLWHYVLEEPYLARNPHLSFSTTRNHLIGPASPKIFPASVQEKRYHSFAEAGHFTSACSAMIYRDRLLFGDGPAQHAFTCEPFHNLVHHAVLEEDGVSFRAVRDHSEKEGEFLSSADRWFRPVMVREGPDGGLWVVDMYRYMIEHPEWLPESGRQDLAPYYRAGEERGRIYRIVPKNQKRREVPAIHRMSPVQWVALLAHPSGWVRDKAQQLLSWEKNKEVLPKLFQSWNSSPSIAAGPILHSLKEYQALTLEILKGALLDSNPHVRREAIRLMESQSDTDLPATLLSLVNDPHPKVRLQLALSLGHWKDSRAAAALIQLARHDSTDPLARDAILSSLSHHVLRFVEGLRAEVALLDLYQEPLFRMLLAQKNRTGLAILLSSPQASSQETTRSQFQRASIFLGLLAERGSVLADWQREDDILTHELSKLPGLFSQAEQWLQESPGSPGADPLIALELLQKDPLRRSTVLPIATRWLQSSRNLEQQKAAAAFVLASPDPSAPSLLLAHWTGYGPELRERILSGLLSRESWTGQVLQHITAKKLSATDLNQTQRTRLLQHPNPVLQRQAQGIFASLSTRVSVVEKFQPALSLSGDASRGKAVFQRLCQSCHRLGNDGGEIGPDLNSVAEHPAEKLLVSILDPNASIEPGYLAYECVLADDEELYGRIAGETSATMTIKTMDGQNRTVPRNRIKKFRATNLSLMPEGLEEGLSHQELADLLAALKRAPERRPPGRLRAEERPGAGR